MSNQLKILAASICLFAWFTISGCADDGETSSAGGSQNQQCSVSGIDDNGNPYCLR